MAAHRAKFSFAVPMTGQIYVCLLLDLVPFDFWSVKPHRYVLLRLLTLAADPTTPHYCRTFSPHQMASLLALLSQRQPNLQTRKGLILTGLQNDFLSPGGKLRVSSEYDYIDRIRELVPAFREHGDVIWVRSQYEADREVTAGIHEAGDSVIAGPLGDYTGGDDYKSDADRDSPVPSKKARTSLDDSGERSDAQERSDTADAEADEELFLSNSSQREACCMKGTTGVEFATQIKDIIDSQDLQVVKTYYSAFGSTSLLLTLRSKLITELFVGGNMTNLSVFATAMDAARYGIKITLLEDCLGYRNKSRHDAALRALKDVMGADVMTAARAIEVLKNPPEEEPSEEDGEDEDEIALGEEAASTPAGTLEADSDEDEEFEMPSTVRLPFSSTSTLPSRPAPSTIEPVSSHPRPPEQEATPQSRGTPQTADDSAPNHDINVRTASESSVRSDQNRLESGVDRRSGLSTGGSIAADDSPQKVKIRASLGRSPWERIMDVEWTQKQTDWGRENRPSEPATSSHPGLGAIAALMGLDQRTVDEYEAMMQAFKSDNADVSGGYRQGQPLFGEGSEEGSAGSRILYDFLPPELAQTVFDELNAEINWQRMHHQTGEVPRLVCCQGTVGEDGSMPVYRHPSDQTLPLTHWSPTVDRVRKAAEKVVGHPLNHALIQLYRGGTDFISEHSDKTLDIAHDSQIVNVSFGAQRTMRLRTKRDAAKTPGPPAEGSSPPSTTTRVTRRVPLPHNSLLAMTLPTNATYLHSIPADKRPSIELTEAEKAFSGQRISLTFRHIATFLSANSSRIWGQGATGKKKEDARAVVEGGGEESEALVRAFGKENQSSRVEWGECYAEGSDVLHLR